MSLKRSSGILLHPTSFPGPDGIGDIGPQAYRWIDFLKRSGCSIWQTLPLGPTGFGDSPYQCFSAFAGNPYLISAPLLLDENLLSLDDLNDRPDFPTESVDYGKAIQWKKTLLQRAYSNYRKNPVPFENEFSSFCIKNKWLNDYSIFMAIKDSQNGNCWISWPEPLKNRNLSDLAAFSKENSSKVEMYKFQQFLFFRQWLNLKKYANNNGITLIGDIPIFVSLDSADVWSNKDLFYLDEGGNPTVVAGVPPDYFSPTGQLWGNPIYKWPIHTEKHYEWWINRVKACLVLCDLIRLDHFRGFSGYWEVPAKNTTAEIGRWVQAPGKDFLEHLQKALGYLPLIAEDLGEISQDVVDMRDSFSLPGMKILQFGFSGDARDLFLPPNYIQNCIAYTGTHDNDTVLGWYRSASEHERDFARRFLNSDGSNISWDMIRAIWESISVYAIAPLQDFLSLGNEGRMNFPGRPQGNWSYRYKSSDLTPDLAFHIYEINQIYNRLTSINTNPVERPTIPYQEP